MKVTLGHTWLTVKAFGDDHCPHCRRTINQIGKTGVPEGKAVRLVRDRIYAWQWHIHLVDYNPDEVRSCSL